MTHYLVQHYFQDQSGLAEDRYTNVFHVEKQGGDLDAEGLLNVLNNVITFYSGQAAGATDKIYTYMARHALGVNSRCAIYRAGVSPPNPPLLYLLYDPAALGGMPSGASMPAEVATCISYAGNPVSGLPVASVRGRTYIGPLNINCSAATGTAKARPQLEFRTNLCKAFHALNAAIPTDTPGTYLRQYSPTHNSLHPITQIWSDDAWDTQRRRGGDPTSRVSEPV